MFNWEIRTQPKEARPKRLQPSRKIRKRTKTRYRWLPLDGHRVPGSRRHYFAKDLMNALLKFHGLPELDRDL